MLERPAIVIPDRLEVARAETKELAGGMKLHLLRSNEFEVIRLSFVVHAGSVMQKAPFVAGATANLLAEGSEHMSGHEIAERLDYYGSFFEVSLDRDYAYISFCSLSKYLPQTLEVVGEILLHPTFPEQELRNYCEKRRQQLAVERQKVDMISREAFGHLLFGEGHPYGATYPEDDYLKLEREQLIDFYHRHYTRGNCFVVCSGRITAEDEVAIEALCNRLPEGEALKRELPTPKSDRCRLVERSEALQSAIRIGRLLFPRTHPDFVGMQVVATLLGGYFGARLMQNLRERNGFTYGVGATVVNFEQAGYFIIATQVGAEYTEAALREIDFEIARLCEELVPERELALARNILTGEMMRILDGPFGIADVTIENILSGRDNRAVEEQLREIRQITPERIRELARRYLRADMLSKVVVGRGITSVDLAHEKRL